VIPGFTDQVVAGKSSVIYKGLLTDLAKAGYKIVPIKINWRNKTIFDWINEADAQIVGIDPSETVLIGFSFGAMIACKLATKYPFKKVILCSLSSYWAEDLPNAKKWWLRMVGKKRTEAFKEYRFRGTVLNYKAKETKVFLGAIEALHKKYPVMLERGKKAGDQLPNASFNLIEGAGHNISHPNYRQAIVQCL
jgi:pimeloyl-ACP methyl ester carboxylesterase